MIRSIINLLIFAIAGSKQEPTYDLRRREPKNFKRFNWTFILLTLAMVLFFLILFLLMVFGFSGTESGIHYNHFGDIL